MNATPHISSSPDSTGNDLKDLHRECFACGQFSETGLQLHFYVQPDGVASAVWHPLTEFRSYPDRVHGGIIATLLDSAIVHALFAKGVVGVTAECTIRYRNSVSVTEPVHIRGWVESEKHGLYLCRAEIHQGDRQVVRATAKFMAMPEQFS